MDDTKDGEIFAELVEGLQGDRFHNMVLEQIEELSGRPLSEAERRDYLAMLRNGTHFEVRAAKPLPN